jgi:hypothetical protein
METLAQSLCSSSMELASTERLKSAWLRSEVVKFGDPILARAALPFQFTFFPLGFPVSIATNSQMVCDAAKQSWGGFKQFFNRETIHLEIGVSAGDSLFCPPAPVCRMRNHLITNIADGENFAISDLAARRGIIWTTDAALQHGDYFRYFFLESAAMCQISGRYATGIHGACVELDGHGILLCGDSGVGKSTLAYACTRAGWTYVTDDGSYLVNNRSDRLVVGNCAQIRFRPAAETLFPELHGLSVTQRLGGGKPSVELQTHSRPVISTAETAQIKKIVFLKRHVSTQELTTFPRAVARLYMEQRVNCIPYCVDEQMKSIDRLLEVDIYELRYNELEWAIRTLTQLIREGR